MLRRRLIGNKKESGPSLPDGYVLVPYIDARTVGPYIALPSTGIKLQNFKCEFKADYKATEYSVVLQHFFDSPFGGNSSLWGGSQVTKGVMLNDSFVLTDVIEENTPFVYRVDANVAKVTINSETMEGSYYNPTTAQLNAEQKEIYIFNYGNSVSNSNKAYGKIYYLKVWNGNNLYYDLYPVIDDNGVACLWDDVHRTTYRNAGTGYFFAPGVVTGEYKKVEWIQGDGTAFINTNKYFTNGIRVRGTIELYYGYVGTVYGWYGSNNGMEGIIESIGGASLRCAVRQGQGGGAALSGNIYVGSDLNKGWQDFEFATNSITGYRYMKIGNLLELTDNNALTSINEKTIGIFGRTIAATQAYNISKNKLKNTLYIFNSDDELVLSLVPVRRTDGTNEGGMYDMLTGDFYGNSSTSGAFLIGSDI